MLFFLICLIFHFSFFIFRHFQRGCLFLYKVDSLRAGFNLKYVYVPKSLTLFSKID